VGHSATFMFTNGKWYMIAGTLPPPFTWDGIL
jgi:hypothetical protein